MIWSATVLGPITLGRLYWSCTVVEEHVYTTASQSTAVPSHSTYRAEIEALHEFFVDWYSGALDRDAFTRLERTLAPDFELVTPDGNRRDRAAVVSGIREDYGRDDEGTFSIDIRNVEVVEQMDGFAVVRYEEFQETTDGTTGRISTALFRDDPSAPGGVVWVDLHDTWLDDGSE
nr:DUF4440 domain-containing protein [Natrialba sp. INN-245]